MFDLLIRELVIHNQLEIFTPLIRKLKSLNSFTRAYTHLRALVDIWVVTGSGEDNNTSPRYKELLKSAADRLVRRLNKRIGSFNYSNRRIRTHRKVLKLANRIRGAGVYCVRETYFRLEVPDFLERLHGYHIGEE